MFDSLQDRLQSAFKNLRGKGRLSEADIDATLQEMRVALLDADVAVSVVRDFLDRIRVRALGSEVSGALNPAQQVIKIVNDELVGILGGETRRIRFAKTAPTVIMLAGLQGAGKTTLAGKLARWLKENGKSPMLVAADLQRPNAVTQLQVVGEQAGVTVFAPEPGNDGTSRNGKPGQGRQGVHQGSSANAARRRHRRHGRPAGHRRRADEAGRQDPRRRRPGRSAVRHRRDDRPRRRPHRPAFAEGVDFTGVVLTKLDGDARGGAALSVRSVTGRPIMFASTGEKLDDFEAFHPDRMASRILDMGDVMTLIEQAERAFDAEQAAKDAEKLVDGSFTLQDFLTQMEAIAKMGSMTKLVGMLPGMGQFKEQLANFDEREVDRIKAMILSMTPANGPIRRSSTVPVAPHRSRLGHPGRPRSRASSSGSIRPA